MHSLIPTHIHPHSPTPINNQPKKGHTHPHPTTTSQKKVTLTHTHPQRAIKRSHSPTITHISQKISHSPTSTHTQPKRSHSPTPTHAQAKKGLTHPHPAKKGSHPSTHNWKKEFHVSNTWYIGEKYSFSRY